MRTKTSFPSFLFVFLCITWISAKGEMYEQSRGNVHRNCIPITIPTCMDLAYNHTLYPNILNHQNQQDAAAAIAQFNPLIQVKCSEDIKLFLCTVYAPVCTVLEKPLPPCRHLCQSAKTGCESLMIKFGFRWPELLECSRFPTQQEAICVGENKTSASTTSPNTVEGSLECPTAMRTSLRSHSSSLHLPNTVLQECSLPCTADSQVPILLDSRMRRLLRFWTGGCAVACAVCSLFTIFTFLIDLHRFQYPVRPILYMAICYLAISSVYMIGVVGEDRFSCSAVSGTGQPLVTQGVDSVQCSTLAVVHYFFTIASSVWWVVLCLAWFLAASLKWGQESIDSLSVYFHFASWGLPALMSVVVLVTNSLDGDVFTGICSVGNLRRDALFFLVFVPIMSFIFIGFVLLAFGIVSMLHIRRYIKLQQPDVERTISKLEKLMFRIGAFAVLYALPTALSAAILCYQSIQMPHWLENWYAHRCALPDRDAFGFTTSRTMCPPKTDVRPPDMMLFVVKYFSQLIVGITCAVWVCSAKTISSYQKFSQRICGDGVPPPVCADEVPLRNQLMQGR